MAAFISKGGNSAFLVSISEDEALKPDLVGDADFKSIPFLPSCDQQYDERAFLFMDNEEKLHIATPELFSKKLKCDVNKKIKVISIFGNTGDGKSHTMNHVFFNGEQVFKTSPEQSSCTIGVYAAMESNLGVLCLDTEGLLGSTKTNNRRMRMLLKTLAISDIVVYRTRSERLHTDMYEFLDTASKAFTLHFSQALQTKGKASMLGPAVIIFHETRNTKPFDGSVKESAEDKLRDAFNRLNCETNAFSSLRYVGVQTPKDCDTDFTKIRHAIQLEIENTSVRSPRQPSVIFKAIKLLNQKFDGEITETTINPFPEQYFTCPVHCESCSRRCQRSMGHIADGEPHLNTHPCNYQHQFENKVYLCKFCYNRGKENIVRERTQTQTDSTILALAKYAWKGAAIECPACGEIYRARQYWYGNKSPEEESVRSQIVHVWKCDNNLDRTTVHSAQMVVDSVSHISEAIANISAPSAKAISGWVADKLAPIYWKPNSEIIFCYACKYNFDKTGLKRHHCRGCGEGFCNACSQHEIPVPARGWLQPVRVCNDCYQQLQHKSDTTPEAQAEDLTHCKSNPNIAGSQPQNNEGDILVRKYGETIYNAVSTVAAIAFEYPKEIIKDSVRPSYWVPDAESPACFICKSNFGTAEELANGFKTGTIATTTGTPTTTVAATAAGGAGTTTPAKVATTTTIATTSGNTEKAMTNGTGGGAAAAAAAGTHRQAMSTFRDCSRHHCRRCGQAVCAMCSKSRMPVPERGWHTDVRVCDSCACIPTMMSTALHDGDMSAALASAINGVGGDGDGDDEQLANGDDDDIAHGMMINGGQTTKLGAAGAGATMTVAVNAHKKDV